MLVRPRVFGGILFNGLLVVAIIVMLLAMWWVMQSTGTHLRPHIQSRTIALLSEIEGGLDDYKIDHGSYPINPAENREDAAIEGARVLYQHLSGDFDLDGEFDSDDPDAKVYVDSLDFKSSQKANKGTVKVSPGGHFYATEPYGNPIRYLCDPPNRIVGSKIDIRTLNPTYDLWSTGKVRSGDNDEEARAKWITNWGAQ